MTLNTALRKGSLKVCLDPSLSCLTKKENIVSKVKRTGRAEERSSFSSIQPGRAGGRNGGIFPFLLRSGAAPSGAEWESLVSGLGGCQTAQGNHC